MHAVIQEGKHYLLTKGRRAGQKVTVSKVVDDRFVVVKTEKGAERKCSVNHLVPVEHK
jgi:ribosomal protein L14E/L6E/L27E